MNKKPNARSIRTIIAATVMAIIAVLLFNPDILPFSEQTKKTIAELEKTHFLIERSGKITTAHILTLILSICVLWLVFALLRLLLKAIAKKNNRTRTVATMVLGALNYLVVIAAVIWGLSILGVNTTAVLAGVGILGLIVGFGAQSLIEDIITGIFIIFEGKYSIGDIIILDDFRGIVRDIGVRTTTIEDAGGNLKIVNNSDIRNFQNRSRNPSLALCDVAVSYETDLMKLEDILREAMPWMYEMHKDIYLKPPRYLGVQELADSGVNLRLAVDVEEENIFIAQRFMNRDVRVWFAQKGVEIPFPQVVVHHGD